MSVADQINRIKTNIANTYTAAQAKGATMPQTQNSDNLAACVQSITTGGGGGDTQFGLTAEQMLGTLDSDGNLTMPTLPSITFTGLKNVSDYVFAYKFYQRTFETDATVLFPDLTNIAQSGMNGCFSNCTSLTSADLSALTSVDSSGLQTCFYECTSLTNVDLSALTTVDGNGMYSCFTNCTSLTSADLSALTTVDGTYGMYSCFYGCTSLTNVDLSALTTVDGNGLGSCFSNCTSLTNISFPSLTTVQTNSFGDASFSYCFSNCTALTEIHFRADAQTAIEAMTGYADKWGAINATIYFSL